ncbi:MAG: heavy metal translocating P-type ATPase [Desulfobulbaceae bacterium]|jgi:Cu+-exporting ATPase|nr:heavy metal translocating P-type ATPase [Desulfobulbaceae bacterium]
MIQELSLGISGMHCASCSTRIENVVSRLEGVHSCVVNLAAETINLKIDTSLAPVETIADTISQLGFSLLLPQEDLEKQIDLEIEGMHCASCSTRIEKVVGELEGVVSCVINLASEQCRIVMQPSAIRVRDIIAAIQGLGFEAKLQTLKSLDTTLDKQEQTRLKLQGMRQRLYPSVVLAMLLMFFSMGEMLLPYPSFLSSHHSPFVFALIQFCLVLPVLFIGRHFYITGIPALLRRIPNMDSLIAMGTGAAFIYSTWNLVEIGLGIEAVQRAHDLYFESAAMLIALVSVGKYLETRAKANASNAISQLLHLTPDSATLLQDGKPVPVLVDDIMIGDELYVKPGERIPVDSLVVEGISNVDESMLTGESLAVSKQQGDSVFGGTLNKNNVLVIRAVHVGQETMLARIIKLVQDAQGSKAPIASIADRISLYFVPVVMLIAIIAGLSWFFMGGMGFSFSLRIFIAVMVIACPCAMGLATPISIMVGTGRGAQLGVLVKNGQALEMAGKIDVVVFDKTGTLTYGKPTVTDLIPYAHDYTDDELLQLVGCAEAGSEHPLAEAILSYIEDRGMDIVPPTQFTALAGRGIKAVINGKEVLFGNHACMVEQGVTGVSQVAVDQALRLSENGKTVLYVAVDNCFQALIGVADQIKDETPAVINLLKDMGVEVVMLTGDNEKTAQAIAARAGIDTVIAEVLPTDKAGQIERLQGSGKRVAMVGDGINDAPALACADVGIGMGTGIDVAIESADIVLMTGHLSGVVTALALSRATMLNIKQNLFWAFAYNVIGIPVAAGLLYVFGGPTLNPMLAGGAMALSSVSVVTNALRLRLFKPEMV